MLQMINDVFTMSGPDRPDLLSSTPRSREKRCVTRRHHAEAEGRITAGAVAALVIVGWLAVIAVALMAG